MNVGLGVSPLPLAWVCIYLSACLCIWGVHMVTGVFVYMVIAMCVSCVLTRVCICVLTRVCIWLLVCLCIWLLGCVYYVYWRRCVSVY